MSARLEKKKIGKARIIFVCYNAIIDQGAAAGKETKWFCLRTTCCLVQTIGVSQHDCFLIFLIVNSRKGRATMGKTVGAPYSPPNFFLEQKTARGT